MSESELVYSSGVARYWNLIKTSSERPTGKQITTAQLEFTDGGDVKCFQTRILNL